MNFYIYTLGCKVNQYESEYMARILEENGYTRSFVYPADIIIINSCTVTGTGDNKVLKYLRRCRRENSDSVIILTGCMTQAFPNLDENYDCADIVLGNYSRKKIVDALSNYLINRKRIVDITPHNPKSGERFENMSIDRFEEHTRAFVKIEDGCNRFCSYCVIPYARGRVRSKTLEDLKSEIDRLSENGYKEIVLVGINLSCYGEDLGLCLCDAVECVCANSKIERVRLGSIEPEKMDIDTLKRLSLQDKFCPQFHLSLQSGSDTVLKRMNRHYDTSEYSEIVNNIRKIFKNPAVTTDIMTGFPGESESEHRESLDFARKTGFAKVHVFPYSRRNGTVADKMDNQIDNALKNLRCKDMIELTQKSRNKFLNSQIGLTVSVLFERKKGENDYEGYALNYTPVRVKSSTDLSGKTLNVIIKSVKDDYCVGELADE